MKPLAALAAQWPQIDRLLDEALALPAGERGRWVDALDASTHGAALPILRQLLAAQGAAETDDFLVTLPRLGPWPGGGVDSVGAPAAGVTVGPWKLVREIGQGGMGSVWLAERADGSLRRQVALKLPRLTWARGLAERMARERDILATLEHPHIARLYDAGVDAHGRPWLALEYVQGRPIDSHCRERALDARQVVALLGQVCEAVAYAHRRLVIHRDLKPGNILVTDDGQVKLLDFGIAKLVEGETAASTALTAFAGRALTPEYASPEQVRGQPLGTASDVYSLGVVAFELLTGRLPYLLERGSAAELEEAIAQADVPLASSAAEGAASQRALRGDLDAILNKALKKSLAERYTGVDALALDLQRHLNSEPVSAQPDAWSYRASKYLRRHRVGVTAGGLVAAALLAGTGLALWQAQRAEGESRRAVAANERAQASQRVAEHEAELARAQRAVAVDAGERAERLAMAERDAAASADAQARRADGQAQRADAEARRALLEASRAQTESRQARAVRDFLIGLFGSASASQRDALKVQAMTAVELLDRGVARIDTLTADAPEAKVELLRLFANVNMTLGRYDTGLALTERAVVEADRVHGRDAEKALTAHAAHARALSMTGRRDEARAEIDATRQRLERLFPDTLAFADALRLSASIYQIADPARANAFAERSVQVYERIAARAAPGTLDNTFHNHRAAALFNLGLSQQTAGQLVQSARNLQAATELTMRVTGADGRDTMEIRSRLLFSQLALGRFDEVVRDAPPLLASAAPYEMASLMLPQVRLYYARALVARGDLQQALQQLRQAASERARMGNPNTSPRVDTFRGQLAMVALDEAALDPGRSAERSAEPIAELEAMLAAGQGLPSTRMSWHTALLRVYVQGGQLAKAREHAAAARQIADSTSAFLDIRILYWETAAQLYAADAAAGADAAPLEATLRSLREAEAGAESEHARARLALAQAQALARAGRAAEAADALRPWVAGSKPRTAALQHVAMRAQIQRLAGELGLVGERAAAVTR